MRRLNDIINNYRYTALLIFLLLLIVFPFFVSGPIERLLSLIFMSLVFISAIEVVSSGRKFLIGTIVIVFILIIVQVLLYLIEDQETLRIGGYIFFLVFMGFIIYRLFRKILKTKKVDREDIMAAISIYLLIGVIGALLAGIIDVTIPQAYSISSVDQGLPWNNFLYYSFVTLTTLGYGDIVPIMEESKALAFLISIVGQFYLTIIIAILVAKFITHSDSD